MLSGLKVCSAPAPAHAAPQPMFPEILHDIPQELYCRRYAPLWSLAMSRPLTHAQYRVATDVSEFDAQQVHEAPNFITASQ